LISIPPGYQDNIEAEIWTIQKGGREDVAIKSNPKTITDVILGKWTRAQNNEGYSKCEQLTPKEIADFTTFMKNMGLSVKDIAQSTDEVLFNLLKTLNNNINWIPATITTINEIYLARPIFVKTIRPKDPSTIDIAKTKITSASIPSRQKVLKNIQIPQRLVDLYSEIPTEEFNKNTQEDEATSSEDCVSRESEVNIQDADSDFEAHQKDNSKIGGKVRTPAIEKLIKRAILLCKTNHIEPTENSIWDTVTSVKFMNEEGIKRHEKNGRHEIKIPIAKNKISKKSYSKKAIWEKARKLLQHPQTQ